MELMKKVLQDYCNEKGHTVKETSRGFKIYFDLNLAVQVDIEFLVECAKKFGWKFFVSSDLNGTTYALIYESIVVDVILNH